MGQRFWRIFRLLAFLSLVVAAIAVVLVTQGAGEVHASLIIATFVGVAATMLLGSALMALMFLSSRSGHDEAAAPHVQQENEDE
jgi:ABC-type Fe3+-siderophore transport system permease subunit